MADTTDASSDTSVAENSDMPETTTNVEDIPTIHTSPIVIDWRDKGVGVMVYPWSQSLCQGMDWSIVAATNMKANYKIQKRKLFDFSIQQLIDCSSTDEWGNMGCFGGFIANSFNYMMHNQIV
jgi:hypothetical protein